MTNKNKAKLTVSVIGLLLWCFAPFATISIFWGDAPSGLKCLFTEYFIFESQLENFIFWTALFTGLTYLSGAITVFTGHKVITAVFSVAAIISYIVTICILGMESDFVSFLKYGTDYGFWILMAGLLLPAILTDYDKIYGSETDLPDYYPVGNIKNKPSDGGSTPENGGNNSSENGLNKPADIRDQQFIPQSKALSSFDDAINSSPAKTDKADKTVRISSAKQIKEEDKNNSSVALSDSPEDKEQQEEYIPDSRIRPLKSKSGRLGPIDINSLK